MSIIRVIARLVIVAELLHVAKQFNKQLFFMHTKVAEKVARIGMPTRSPDQVAPILRQMVKRYPHLSPVHQFKREMMNMVIPLVQKRHDVMIPIDMHPGALITNPVCELEAEHISIPLRDPFYIAGQIVDMPKLAWMKCG